jgi:8-amino-3,8-dideoxy-alpha-D-manno-octulosonate transaminase
VGIAQLGKLDRILSVQKKNYTTMRNAIADIPGVSFRRVPEGGVENYSFLNFFMPTEEAAKKAHAALGAGGVDGCFYWYTNNWHYINGWEHLKNLKTMGNLPSEVKSGMSDLNSADFSKSDAWMGRTISCLVKIGWSDTEVLNRAEKMRAVLTDIA